MQKDALIFSIGASKFGHFHDKKGHLHDKKGTFVMKFSTFNMKSGSLTIGLALS